MARESAQVQELRRELGGLLAQCRREKQWSQARLAEALHYHRSAVSHLEAGRHPAPRAFWERADALLGADGALLAAYEALEVARRDATELPAAVPRPDVPPAVNTGRRTALKLSLAAAVAPEILHRVLSDAAAEAMEFTRLTGVSSVGRGTVDHLELVVTDLHRGYSHEAPSEQFVVARAFRSRVDELIRGRHTLGELRELYVYAGVLSELLAWLAHDLGNPRTAQAYAVDSFAHAEQAGHGERCGWAADAMTAIATYAGRPDQAARAAMKGIAQVPRGHPLAIRLRAKAARAYALVGDRQRFDSAFTEARLLHERMPATTPSRFAVDAGFLASYSVTAYPAEAYLRLGDFEAARTHAEAALVRHESAPVGGSSPGKGDIARFDLATAMAHLGEPDSAASLGQQALGPTCALSSVRSHARDLDAVLVGRYPKLSCVREFHEQYRQLAHASASG